MRYCVVPEACCLDPEAFLIKGAVTHTPLEWAQCSRAALPQALPLFLLPVAQKVALVTSFARSLRGELHGEVAECSAMFVSVTPPASYIVSMA